jgi:hypothetical protein
MSEEQEVKVEEKKEDAPVEKQPDPSQVVADALKLYNGAPTKEQIEAWKQVHGEVFCSGFSETELYMWRPLTRKEFVDLQAVMQQGDKPVSSLEAEGLLVNTCILWSSDIKVLAKKAGSISALHEQIMTNSNFMDPRLAAALVIKL